MRTVSAASVAANADRIEGLSESVLEALGELAGAAKVAGAANKGLARARSASSKPACPTAFSQKAPVPAHPTVRSRPDSNSPSTIFMPRSARALRHERRLPHSLP